MKTNSRIVVLFALMGVSTPSYAGFGSHGGDGVIIGKKVFLFDLFEQGIHESPSLNEDLTPNPLVVDRVKAALSAIPVSPDLVAKKLQAIRNKNAITAAALLTAIEMINWRGVNSRLNDIDDTDGSDLDYRKYSLVQLAARSSRSVMIDLKWFNKLSPGNQVALIFHEVVYALNSNDRFRNPINKTSRVAREFTGYLFSSRFELDDGSGLMAMISEGRLPFVPQEPSEVTDDWSLCTAPRQTQFERYRICINLGWAADNSSLSGINWSQYEPSYRL